MAACAVNCLSKTVPEIHEHVAGMSSKQQQLCAVWPLTFNFLCLVCFSGEPFYADKDDDFIFEDFARLRLKGHEGDDTEA